MVQNIKIGEIAKRYATALLQKSIEENSIESVSKDVEHLRSTLASNKEFSSIMKSPALSKDDAKAVLGKVCEGLGLGDGVKGLCAVLCENRRAFALSVVLDTFEVLVQKHKGIMKAEVISATELSDAHKVSVAEAVAKVMNTQVDVVHSVDSSIIGGLIVKIGSNMLDASVQTKLEKLKLEMKGA